MGVLMLKRKPLALCTYGLWNNHSMPCGRGSWSTGGERSGGLRASWAADGLEQGQGSLSSLTPVRFQTVTLVTLRCRGLGSWYRADVRTKPLSSLLHISDTASLHFFCFKKAFKTGSSANAFTRNYVLLHGY